MSTTVDLHALYATRSIGKARNFLLRSSSSSSGGGHGTGSLSRSPNLGGGGGMGMIQVSNEANRKDDKGRTVLHLAVSELAEWALDWVEVLLRVPGVNVNSVDKESGWSALHRALYVGNVAAARQLMARDDIDPHLKDHEGLTPFDVYNSTVEGTNPSSLPSLPSSFHSEPRYELFTWGSNRNFVLGFAGDNDRLLPERVNLQREEKGLEGVKKFEPLRVREVGLGRLHSGLVTDESTGNVRLCGYGTGGRLGTNAHTQFTFSPLKDFPHHVSSVILSPDHTVLITSSGSVFTFGLNRFEQLGYSLDTPPSSSSGEPIQSSPRRVVGALKKEVVLGGAASRTHTVVFTSDSLFTWGTNRGQLGYPSSGEFVQLLPRKVTILKEPVVAVTATEGATGCLLESNDVVVLWHEGYVKVVFPLARFPSKMQAYRPPQVVAKPNIIKISSCGNTFAALSSLGDVFTFALDSSPSSTSTSFESPSSLARLAPKPQRIWSLRRKFTAVTDVGVGLDGTIILSTVSGHVFVRTRKFEVASIGKSGANTPTKASGSGGWKFSRVPYLQRCIKVSANSTGAFAAIRADVPLKVIEVEGPTLAENLLGILPHWRRIGPLGAKIGSRRKVTEEEDEDDDGEYEIKIQREVEAAARMLDVLDKWDESWEEGSGGSDVVVVAEGKSFPAHGLVLGARSSTLAKMLTKSKTIVLDCSAMAVLLLLHYLYSDDLPAVWDGRIGIPLKDIRSNALLWVYDIKTQLVRVAHTLGLTALSTALQAHFKTSPLPTLVSNIGTMLLSPSAQSPSPLAPDIVLELADRNVKCHSVVLRARCTFFATFYEDEDWTMLRRNDGVEGDSLYFDLKHIEWDVMVLVLKHIYTDAGVEMFDSVDRPTANEYIDFVTQVLAAANELLLDKLKLVCSSILRGFVTLHNVCSILVDAAFYEASDLVRACMFFIASSLETVLESHLLDDLPPDLVAAVSSFCQERQGARMPISRSGMLVQDLMIKHKDWLADLDIGRATGGARKFRPVIPRSPGLSPSMLSPDMSPRPNPRSSPRLAPDDSPNLSPTLPPLPESSDEPFTMDEDFSLDISPSPTRASFGTTNGSATRRKSLAPSSSPSQPSHMVLGSPPPPRLQPWTRVTPDASKAPTDLRSIMATEAERRPRTPQTPDRVTSRPGSSTSLNKISSPVSGTASWARTSVPGSWRASDVPRPSISAIQSEQAAPPLIPTPPSVSRSLPRAALPTTTPSPSVRPSETAAGFGPIITPTRLSNNRAVSGQRQPKSSFGAADIPWTNYTVAPVNSALDSFASSSTSPTRASFASIQSQQRAEVEAIKEVKAPRSFAEVMASEAAEAQSKAEAAEFERWFAAEALKVQAEAGIGGSGSGPSNSRGVRGGKSSGRGRGGGAGGNRGGKKSAAKNGALGETSATGSSTSRRATGKGVARGGGGGGGNKEESKTSNV